jgi:anti-sigma factor RsiW
MNCLSENEEGFALLTGYLVKTLDAVRAAELDRHIQECTNCRGLVSSWTRLDEFAVPEVSSNFDARLYARIAAEETRRANGWRRWFWVPIAPIAAAVVAVVLYMHIQVPDPPQQTSRLEIEQVAQAVDDLDLLTPLEK